MNMMHKNKIHQGVGSISVGWKTLCNHKAGNGFLLNSQGKKITCKLCLKKAIKQWVGQPQRRAKERLLFLTRITECGIVTHNSAEN